MTENYHLLGDDLPKKDPWREDRLGFASFAERMAKIIQNLQAQNGYVIGLHGAWGSGKSTVLNFVAAHIEKANETIMGSGKIEVIDFRPWIVSGHQDLIAAFFKLLSEKLGPRDGWWKRQRKRVVRLFGYGSDHLVETVTKLAIAVDPTLGVASGTVGAVAKRSLGRLIDRFLNEPSLQTIHQQLAEQLARSQRRFLVVIDDLDRLEDEEVKDVMRMVKTIGHLPNVVYLLAYDRNIVWKALDGQVERVGPRFAEKIVQQDLELPKPSRQALMSLLEEQIEFIPQPPEGSMRWFHIVRYGLFRWIRSPRDVLRLGNAVKFSWSALEGEVDPHDVLAMEGLKLFDTAAFAWLRDNRDFLFSEGVHQMAQEDAKRDAVEKLKQRLHDGERAHVMEVVSAMFPQVGKWADKRPNHGGESHVETLKRRGVGSEAGYDSYFALYPSRNAVPKSVIDEVMTNLGDVGALERTIRVYLGKKDDHGQSLIAGFLDELHARFLGQDPARPTPALLDALFRVGEEVVSLEGQERMFLVPPRSKLWFMIKEMLEQWGPEAAGERLLQAFEASSSVMFRADVYVSCGQTIGVFKSDSRQAELILRKDFDALGERLLPDILEKAKTGALVDAPYYFDIVETWAHVGNVSDARAWLSQGMADSAEFMSKVGRGLLAHSVGTRVRSYTMRTAPDPRFYNLEQIVSFGRRHLANEALSDEQRSVISEMVRGAEAFSSRPQEEDGSES